MKVTIVGMIYKSPAYLDFMMAALKSYGLSSQKYKVDYLIIANDPTQTIEDKLKNENINHKIFRNPDPNEYYLNRVYRAWNFGGFNADGDIIVFINSDMWFSPNWLDNLLSKLNGSTLPCSQLIESGKIGSSPYAIIQNFGQSAKDFNEKAFLDFAEDFTGDNIREGGLYMPSAFYKKDFIESGGFPEGNIYSGGIGQVHTQRLQSGDDYFFYNNPIMSKKKHITVLNSVVYHIQEGELDA